MSYKLVATLQAAQGCRRPILLRVDPAGDHDGRVPAVLAERLTFLAWALDVSPAR